MSPALQKPTREPKPRKRLSRRRSQPIKRSGRIARSAKPIARSTRRIKVRRPLGTKRREAKDANQIDPLTWAAVLRFYSYRCAYCQDAPAEQQDHIKPIACGGLNVIQNTAPICARCNMNKGTSMRVRPQFKHPYKQEPR